MFACQIAIYVLIGLHGLLALYLLYLNCSCSINLQFELFGGIGSRRSRRMKVNKSVEKKLDISRDEEAQAREDEEAAKLFKSNQTTLGVQTEVQGLYLYPYRQDMQEPNLLGGRNAKNTAIAVMLAVEIHSLLVRQFWHSRSLKKYPSSHAAQRGPRCPGAHV